MLELHLDVTTPQRPFLHLCNRSFEVCPLRDIQNSVHGNNHGIPQNIVQLCDKEFQGIPQNFRQFRIEYGSYGSTKNIRNSLLTEFRGHPTSLSSLVGAGGRSFQWRCTQLGVICEPQFSTPRRGRLPVQSLAPEDAETGGGCVADWGLLS
jgi:hypothetical protein